MLIGLDILRPWLGGPTSASAVSTNTAPFAPARAAMTASLVRFRCGALAAVATVGLVFAAPAALGETAGVAYVGCASDGMLGPIAAPKPGVGLPAPPAGLAVYASVDLATLAPVGWSCFSICGSGGSALVVTPEPHSRDDFIERELAVSGPTVVVIRYSGDTSGRFLAAAIDAQVFQVARRFVQRVKAEGLTAPGDIPAGPTATDRIRCLGDTLVAYETPAGRDGLGTSERIKADGLPIRGAVVLLPKEQMDVVRLAVRQPTGLDALTPTIIRAFERDHGSPPAWAGAH